MTSFTIIGGIDMASILTYRCSAIMAALTCTNNFSMINLGSRGPIGWRMAALTTTGGVNVCGAFACGRSAVMTAGAIAYTRRVGESCIPAPVSAVAKFTAFTRRNMVG